MLRSVVSVASNAATAAAPKRSFTTETAPSNYTVGASRTPDLVNRTPGVRCCLLLLSRCCVLVFVVLLNKQTCCCEKVMTCVVVCLVRLLLPSHSSTAGVASLVACCLLSSSSALQRSSVSGVVATVFGCTGFVGRYVVNKFGARKHV